MSYLVPSWVRIRKWLRLCACRTDNIGMPSSFCANQNPGSDVRRHEGRHILQRDHRLSSGTVVVRVPRRFARKNPDSSAVADSKKVPRRTDLPRHGIGRDVEQNYQHQTEHVEARTHEYTGWPKKVNRLKKWASTEFFAIFMCKTGTIILSLCINILCVTYFITSVIVLEPWNGDMRHMKLVMSAFPLASIRLNKLY